MHPGKRVIATVSAAIGFLIQYAPPFRWTLGPRSRWWEGLRRWLSRHLGSVFDDRVGPRPITAHEYAGSLQMSLAEAEQLLGNRGFRRNPFARLKTRNEEAEVGSWVFRSSPLSRRQLHLMLFTGDESGVDVYAHTEHSSVNPLVAADHVTGSAQNIAAGVDQARDRLPLEQTRATPEPPDGPWSVVARTDE